MSILYDQTRLLQFVELRRNRGSEFLRLSHLNMVSVDQVLDSFGTFSLTATLVAHPAYFLFSDSLFVSLSLSSFLSYNFVLKL
jgi:hypothetical protein